MVSILIAVGRCLLKKVVPRDCKEEQKQEKDSYTEAK
jgi:hypothetical protein